METITKENKELLKDLCTRLPYGVKVQMADGAIEELLNVNVSTFICNGLRGLPKPYLLPFSSMTKEQKIRCQAIQDMGASYSHHLIDRYNEWHLDYRGLIEKGLAIDATGLNIY